MSILDLTGITATFEKLKPGKYLVTAQDALIEENFNKTGKKLSLKLKVVDGDFKNRNIFTSFNIYHENKEAEEIGRKQLKGYMESIGLSDILNDLSELLGKTSMATIRIEKKDDKETPRVSYFEKVDLSLAKDEILPF